MKLRQYVLLGAVIGLALPALLIAFAVATGRYFESSVVAVVIPGFFPFSSSDPGHEMSWAAMALAFLLNACAFASLGLLVGLLRRGITQPTGQRDI